MRQYSAKRDDNESDVVKRLEAVGCFVQKLTQGDGVFDLLVGDRRTGMWHVMEVKDGDKPRASRKLKERQIDWISRIGNKLPRYVVENAEQAVEIIEQERARR